MKKLVSLILAAVLLMSLCSFASAEQTEFNVLSGISALSGGYANNPVLNDLQAQAEAKYHAILASAAVSELPAHAAILATNGGAVLESKAYFHGTKAE